MREGAKPALITWGDLHFSQKPPIARSVHEDWLEVQAGYIKQVERISKANGSIPLVMTGDLNDKWKNDPELINWMLEVLPHSYGIPGQHDLPFHRLEDIKKSTFWTMVKAGRITLLKPMVPVPLFQVGVCLWGFPWGVKVQAPKIESKKDKEFKHLAVVHRYCWMNTETSYPGAPDKRHVDTWRKKLEGFDAAVFGDNHKGFQVRIRGMDILNGGSFLRRKIDEFNYRPSIGVLYTDGVFTRVFLDTSHDQWITSTMAEHKAKLSFDPSEFLIGLIQLGDAAINFADAMKQFCEDNGIEPDVQKIITRCMELKK